MTFTDVVTTPLGGVVLNAGASFVGGLVGVVTFRRKQVREVADVAARDAVKEHARECPVARQFAGPLIVRPFGER